MTALDWVLTVVAVLFAGVAIVVAWSICEAAKWGDEE